MLFKVPDSINLFIEKYAGSLGNEKSRLIPLYMAGILFSPGKRTMTSLGRTVLSEQRRQHQSAYICHGYPCFAARNSLSVAFQLLHERILQGKHNRALNPE